MAAKKKGAMKKDRKGAARKKTMKAKNERAATEPPASEEASHRWHLRAGVIGYDDGSTMDPRMPMRPAARRFARGIINL